MPAGRPAVWNLILFYPLISFLLQYSPQQLGCLRSRWSLEFFVIKINELLNIKLSISIFYRYLHKTGIVWRRAEPTLKLLDPEYPEKMAKITEALSMCSEKHPVFYEDEVDIKLNPKIDSDWYLKG